MDNTTNVNECVMLLCPNLKCRKLLRVSVQCRGKQVRCNFCNITFQVPENKSAEPKEPSS
ncbi:MAG: hypothetical protein MI923_07880 [Phycisphaerales bacterium]|nr:hypothetical protein [Phycisphaerales bacterium]